MRDTEIEVFKACIVQPLTIKSWTKMIEEAGGPSAEKDKTILKIFYKIWSGFTKFIRS
jgi:hypothetical protein